MFKRLRSTGEVADSTIKPNDTPDKIVRSVILVHSGPSGSENTLASSDGDISFDNARIQNVVKNHNAMVTKLAMEYGGFEKMPMGAWAPILDQHSDDSANRVLGRLTGLLRLENRDVPKVGKNVACAVCDVTFLGKDTVEKVKDGRYYHVSVGIDESSDTLGETSVVIEPAAPGAMVLKKAKPKKKLKGVKKMSAKLISKLNALSGELKQLSAKANEQKKLTQLAKRKTEVSARFTKLMADKKMTPAEFKKVDLARLSKLDKESFDDVMHVYDAREAQVQSGQQGSTSAANFSDVGAKTSEDREVKRLKAAVKKNLAKGGMKFKASADEDDDKELSLGFGGDENKMAAEKEQDEKKLDNDGDMAGADVQEKEEMMQQIEENSTQIARVASMVETIIQEMGGDDKEQDPADELQSDDETEMEKSDDEDKKDLDKVDEKEKDKKEENE